MSLTQARLKELLDYDPETGVFTRKITTSARAKAGQVAGTPDGMGYLQTSINRTKYRNHRLAYFYMTGTWPEEDIDHIDRNRSNNRFANLRAVTHAENTHNKCMSRSNTSGFLGVSWVTNICKWEARIGFNGRTKVIGYFSSPELASAAYLAAKTSYHPTAPAQ